MTQRTPCPAPTPLDPQPEVALAAWRYPSTSMPGVTYDVALAPDGSWSCECWPWLDEDACKHVYDARARWHGEAFEANACSHALLFSEGGYRECVLCGTRYDRAAFLLRLRELVVERFRARRRAPPSPWTPEERSNDPW